MFLWFGFDFSCKHLETKIELYISDSDFDSWTEIKKNDSNSIFELSISIQFTYS